jgi:hypothetical protein
MVQPDLLVERPTSGSKYAFAENLTVMLQLGINLNKRQNFLEIFRQTPLKIVMHPTVWH